jgi:hypothetical protein
MTSIYFLAVVISLVSTVLFAGTAALSFLLWSRKREHEHEGDDVEKS